MSDGEEGEEIPGAGGKSAPPAAARRYFRLTEVICGRSSAGRGGAGGGEVGRCRLKPVDAHVESAWVQLLKL
jgi:hypothetical protein